MKKKELIELIISSLSLTNNNEKLFKNYLLSLRSNRNELVNGIVSSSTNAKVKKLLLTKAKNIQNQTRGKIGELLGRIAITQQTEAIDTDLVTDKAIFNTPYGKRRIDVYWEKNSFAVETKMGYITNSKNIRNQIKKDAYLVNNGNIQSVMWMLIKGGSKNVKLNLDEHGISYKEGWPL